MFSLQIPCLELRIEARKHASRIAFINLVALLIAPAVVALSYGDGANPWARWGIAITAGAIAVFAVVRASRRSHAGGVEFAAEEAAIAEGHAPAATHAG